MIVHDCIDTISVNERERSNYITYTLYYAQLRIMHYNAL